MPSLLAILAIGYLLGTIPFGVLLARRKGVDIRAHGSGNPGATNVLRVVGRWPALAVLAGDLGKGVAAVLIARFWPVDTGCPPAAVELGAGLAAMIGHILPFFSRFRGGKGVATAAGVLLVFDPLWFALGGGVFLLLVLTTRWVSVSSMGSALVLAVTSAVLQLAGPWRPPWALTGFCVAAALLIVWAHRGNLANLVAGTEERI